MRKVLIPTDFSPVSRNALIYGLELYKNSDTEFDIIHIYHPSFDPVQPEIIESTLGLEMVKIDIMNDFISSFSKLAQQNNVKLNSRIEIGFTVEKIVEESTDYEIIIMGSTGNNNFINQIFGGISSEVAIKSKCPVLLIPSLIKFNNLRNIIYSYDFDGINSKTLNEVVSFAKRYNSTLHFVHINQNDKSDIKINFPDKLDIDFKTSIVQSDSVQEGLSDYIVSNDIDLVLMATKHRNFWEKIINRSFTNNFL
ncbi:MAG: universal stress protein [Saprospiraceae bacterium]